VGIHPYRGPCGAHTCLATEAGVISGVPMFRLPSQCPVCRSWTALPLCDGCRRSFLPDQPRCPNCALATASGCICSACAANPPLWDAAFALADYAFPWNRLIADFKYRQRPEMAGMFAQLIAEAMRLQKGVQTPADLITAVPMTPERLRLRGYNQAWLVARALGLLLRLPCQDQVIQRWGTHTPQAQQGRTGRLLSPVQTFMPSPGRERLHRVLKGRTVALVDDVLTTGATLHAATQALREAGAARVLVWVIARTPAGTGDNGAHVSHRLGSPRNSAQHRQHHPAGGQHGMQPAPHRTPGLFDG
jgi:ComF family protein